MYRTLSGLILASGTLQIERLVSRTQTQFYLLSRLASPHVYFTTLRNRQLMYLAQHMFNVFNLTSMYRECHFDERAAQAARAAATCGEASATDRRTQHYTIDRLVVAGLAFDDEEIRRPPNIHSELIIPFIVNERTERPPDSAPQHALIFFSILRPINAND